MTAPKVVNVNLVLTDSGYRFCDAVSLKQVNQHKTEVKPVNNRELARAVKKVGLVTR
jgi:hypothetical protein